MNTSNGPMTTELIGVAWHKSTYSGQGGGDCVEVAFIPGAIGVHDSKNADGPALVFGDNAWSAFLRTTQ